MSRIVITGGPYSGKTTFINYLAERGIQTLPESAMQVIDEGAKAIGSDAFKQWRLDNILGFQLLIAQKQRALEACLQDASATFLDRSLIDCIAYLEYKDILCPLEYDLLKNEDYMIDQVLLFDTLPDFDSRSATGRQSTRDASLAIRDKLHEVYGRLGYKVSFIKSDSLEVREKAVCEALNVPSIDSLG